MCMPHISQLHNSFQQSLKQKRQRETEKELELNKQNGTKEIETIEFKFEKCRLS